MSDQEDHILFARRGARDVAKVFHLIANGRSYIRSAPSIIGAPAYITQDVAMNSGVYVNSPECFIAEISDAIVRPPGFIYVGDCIVEESLVNLSGTALLENWMPVSAIKDGRYKAKSSDFRYGSVFDEPAVLLAQNSDRNYGHWIIECLPKIGTMRERYDISKLRFVIGHPSYNMYPIYRDSLAAVGVHESQLVELGDTPTLFTNLIYPSPVTKHPWVTSPRAISFLREIGEMHASAGSASRIYLPRNQIGRRCLVNEPEIRAIVEKKGFVTVIPEEMSFAEQMTIMAGAAVVVGNLGGALSNIVFSPDGVRLLVTATEFMADDFFFDIVAQKNGCYVSLHGKATDPQLGMQSDFQIDPELFSTELDKILA